MLRRVTSLSLVYCLFFYGMIFPSAVLSAESGESKDKLKGLTLNSISLFAAGLAAPAFLKKCKPHMSAKVYAGASLIYLASEALNWSKYSDKTKINKEKIEAIQNGSDGASVNLQIETLRAAAEEKNDKHKSAKKKGSLVQIVGIAYGVATALALWEKMKEVDGLDIAKTNALMYPSGVPTVKPGSILNGSGTPGTPTFAYWPRTMQPGYPVDVKRTKWSTCHGHDPLLELDDNGMPKEVKATEAGTEELTAESSAAITEQINDICGNDADCKVKSIVQNARECGGKTFSLKGNETGFFCPENFEDEMTAKLDDKAKDAAKDQVELHARNNFESYILFSEWNDLQEGKVSSISIAEYKKMKEWATPEDLKRNDWKESLSMVAGMLANLMIPKAQAMDLSKIGLMGGIGALFLQVFSEKSILGKYIEPMDGTKRAIFFGAHAALAFLTGSQIKSGAKQLKEEAQVYTDLADKLEDESNNVGIVDGSENTTGDSGASGSGGGGGGGGFPLDPETKIVPGAKLGNNAINTNGFTPGTDYSKGSEDDGVNCIEGGGSFALDENCECRETNSCQTPLTNNVRVPFAPGSAFATGVSSVRDVEGSLFNGNLTGALASGDTLGSVSPAIARKAAELKDKINNDLIANGQQAVNFEKATATTLNQLKSAAKRAFLRAPVRLRNTMAGFLRKNQSFYGKANPKTAFIMSYKKKINYKNKRAVGNFSKGIDDLNFGDDATEAAPLESEIGMERALAGLKYDGEIIEKNGVSIFQIISNRYLRSGLPRLLKKKK